MSIVPVLLAIHILLSTACLLDTLDPHKVLHSTMRTAVCSTTFSEVSAMVRLKARPDLSVLDDDLAAVGREGSRWIVYRFLNEHSQRTQKKIIDALGENTGYESFWIVNAIHVPKLGHANIIRLLQEAYEDIEAIEPIGRVRRIASVTTPTSYADILPKNEGDDDVQWNIKLIGADQCWKNNITGSGVVLATLDGGVNRYVVSPPFYCLPKLYDFSVFFYSTMLSCW